MKYLVIILIVQLTGVLATLLQIYRKIVEVYNAQESEQAAEYSQAVQTIKKPRKFLPAKKEKVRGRSITTSEDLVDLADVEFEEGYNAILKAGGVDPAELSK
jgi:hypothetical protein